MLSLSIAAKAGLTPVDIDLIKGSVNDNVSKRLGMNISSLEDFIRGS